jgi:hypothetical protein
MISVLEVSDSLDMALKLALEYFGGGSSSGWR